MCFQKVWDQQVCLASMKGGLIEFSNLAVFYLVKKKLLRLLMTE